MALKVISTVTQTVQMTTPSSAALALKDKAHSRAHFVYTFSLYVHYMCHFSQNRQINLVIALERASGLRLSHLVVVYAALFYGMISWS